MGLQVFIHLLQYKTLTIFLLPSIFRDTQPEVPVSICNLSVLSCMNKISYINKRRKPGVSTGNNWVTAIQSCNKSTIKLTWFAHFVFLSWLRFNEFSPINIWLTLLFIMKTLAFTLTVNPRYIYVVDNKNKCQSSSQQLILHTSSPLSTGKKLSAIKEVV